MDESFPIFWYDLQQFISLSFSVRSFQEHFEDAVIFTTILVFILILIFCFFMDLFSHLYFAKKPLISIVFFFQNFGCSCFFAFHSNFRAGLFISSQIDCQGFNRNCVESIDHSGKNCPCNNFKSSNAQTWNISILSLFSHSNILAFLVCKFYNLLSSFLNFVLFLVLLRMVSFNFIFEFFC